MSRVPFELARQAARLGCTAKYCREDKSFEFRLDGEVLAVVFPDGAYACLLYTSPSPRDRG